MDAIGIDHNFHPQHQHHNHGHFATQQLPSRSLRKRKADAPPENNERLSKRLSLLNLEHSGQKLYVPVENSTAQTSELRNKPRANHTATTTAVDDTPMQLDDSKHKVYIYNLDDELSSSDNESDNGRLVFLPDIEKHLRSSRVRIPSHVLQHRGPDQGEFSGKELVLYRVPSSLSVPEEQDSVRRAIIEARARARQRQRERVEGRSSLSSAVSDAVPVMAAPSSSALASIGDVAMDAEGLAGPEEDPDAMELD